MQLPSYGTNVGGLVGSVTGGTIANSYVKTATNKFINGTNVGGLVGNISGIFNGFGHTIDKLYIAQGYSSSNGYARSTGLFTSLSGTGSISNIGLTNLDMSSSNDIPSNNEGPMMIPFLLDFNFLIASSFSEEF